MKKSTKSFLAVLVLMLMSAIHLTGCSDNSTGNNQGGNINEDGSVPCTVPITIFTQYQETPAGWEHYIDVGAEVTVKRPDGTIIYEGVVPEDGYLYTSISCSGQTGWYSAEAKKIFNNQIIHYGLRMFYFNGEQSSFFVRIITYPY